MTLELVRELLTTRDKRELQSVAFGRIESSEIAAFAGELVGTDRKKEWTYKGTFAPEAGSAFCIAAMQNDITSRRCSLTDLNVAAALEDQSTFVSLLSASSFIRSFIVARHEVGWSATPYGSARVSHRDFVLLPFHTGL